MQIPFHLWKLAFQSYIFCPTFRFTSILSTWKGWKCTPTSKNHLLNIHKTSHVHLKIGQKGEIWRSQECFQSVTCLPFLKNLSNKGKKNNEKEYKTKKWATLNLSLHLVFQTMSFFLSLFLWSRLIDFPSKMIPCMLNHNLICLYLGPSSKDLRTNLKLLTNRGVWFHWILLLGPLSKVPIISLPKRMHTYYD